jgi:twitching motility protein PilU
MDVTPFLRLMAEKKASDMFFTTGAPVNVKIGGVTKALNASALEPGVTRKIALTLMSEEQTKQFETGLEVNLRHAIQGLASFRINIFRQRGEAAIVVRHIQGTVPSTDQLGLPPLLNNLVMEKRGLILVVGSTGSGKSTTLAAMIEHRVRQTSGHILTIEDPIEYQFQHGKSIVNQREVGFDTRSYGDALVNAMRESPDLIMIGEIRDRDTMQHAMNYAQTGHLCLSTLHANNSYHALHRIINFFSHDARQGLLLDLSLSLKSIISQRLVRTVGGALAPAVEILLNTARIAELIRTEKTYEIKEAMEQGLSAGNQSFDQSLCKLYQSGRITMEEALLHADSQTDLSWLINKSGGAQATALRPSRPQQESPRQKNDVDFGAINLN